MIKDYNYIRRVLRNYKTRLQEVRKEMGRPLTFTEKIFATHLHPLQEKPFSQLKRGTDYVFLAPDRVAMQDATAQMALLQFSLAGKQAAVPTTVHCDHLIRAEKGADQDLAQSNKENEEVYDFLSKSCQKFGLGFWKPGAGIIHQVFLEQYAFPGGLVIGTDSHTPNAGGLGMIAIGVGGSDAVDVMIGLPWELKFPKLMGVRLTGQLQGWSSPKDVILKLASLVSVKGGTGFVVEYFGPGCSTISATGKATICNMGAEIGATTSIFSYDESGKEYLIATNRKDLALYLESFKDELRYDKDIEHNWEGYFDKVVEINLSELEPSLNGPFTPDLRHTISEMAGAVEKNGWPDKIDVALIGSCTNSSYEDIDKVAHLARQAKELDLEIKTELTVTPGSDQILATIQRDGQLKDLLDIGATVLANACGPCIGQWKRSLAVGEKNTIVTSFNRNFTGRNDGNPATHAFVTSPEIVVGYALSGRLSLDFTKEPLINRKGEKVYLQPPKGRALPKYGYVTDETGYQEKFDPNTVLSINPESSRLESLQPFLPNNLSIYKNLSVLIKVKGKCTTDHISAAGSWLKYRGHLSNISKNTLMGAENAFLPGKKGVVRIPGHSSELSVYDAARLLQKEGKNWVIVGEHNYGEGSSREHAAMQPRYLGALVVLVKSFARIHETNLKRQGIVPLTFANEQDYDLIQEWDSLSFDLGSLREKKEVWVTGRRMNGESYTFQALHSLNALQVSWIEAGSALNYVRVNLQKAS